jgi:glycosyltransferase involved in cell wall biosynthesis
MAANKKDLSIFYLAGGFDGCYYVRGYLPGIYTDQMVCSDFIGKQFNKEEIRKQVEQCDVLVVQRPSDQVRVNIAKYAKQLGKKIIFENDDTYMPEKGIPLKMLANNAQRQIAKKMNENLYEVLQFADGVIASTETLAQEYGAINPNVAVCKNCIDPMDEFPKKKNETGKFRIAFIGSVSTNDDYAHIKEQIQRLDDRGDVTIIVFGIKYEGRPIRGAYEYDYSFWNSLKNVEWQPFVYINEYMMTVADLAIDLAVIPRKESYFNQCKSNLKFLEMSLLHIPVIAQGFTDGTSPYEYDKDYMTVVYNNDEWYDKIIAIKDNYKQYEELAEKAHTYVLENYNIETYAHVWTDTIKKLIENK